MSREISQIGKNIKKLRKQKCLSQNQLSKLADISYNTVIKIESGGITNPSIDTLQKLAKALQDVFIGAKIEGEGGFVNLMMIYS